MKKDAVIFACWCPLISRLQPYLTKIKQGYPNADVFIGVNPSSHSYTSTLLSTNGFFNTIIANQYLELNSDASAYQAALRLYQASNQDYENVYFVHTKGMSYRDDAQWMVSKESYFDSFIDRKQQCEELLKDSEVGGVGIVGQFDWSLYNSGYVNNMKQFCNFKYEYGIDIMWLTTHYVIKADVLNNFINNCHSSFFKTNLKDRYFFEASFPYIVDLCGKRRESCVIWDNDSSNNLTKAFNLYKERNK